MNTQSRNRSSTPPLISPKCSDSHGRLTVAYLCECRGPLGFKPPLLLLLGSFKLFSSSTFVQTLRLLLSFSPSRSLSLRLVFVTLLLVFSHFDFPLVLDRAAFALPFSSAHCLWQMSWPLFFFFPPFPPSLTPPLPPPCLSLLPLSLSLSLYYPHAPKQLQEPLVLCTPPLLGFSLSFTRFSSVRGV